MRGAGVYGLGTGIGDGYTGGYTGGVPSQHAARGTLRHDSEAGPGSPYKGLEWVVMAQGGRVPQVPPFGPGRVPAPSLYLGPAWMPPPGQ